MLSHVPPRLWLSRPLYVFRADARIANPKMEQRPGSTFGYGRVQHRRTWLGDVGFGASGGIDGRGSSYTIAGLAVSPSGLRGGGVMDGECLRLLLQGGDSGSACSKLGRMSVMLQGALF